MGPIRVRYGPARGQRADLWLPSTRRGVRRPPVVVLIHGGFWKAHYTKVLMTRLARSVCAQGWAAWNVEYRRVGAFGGGGGWPATFADVARALDHVGTLDGVDGQRVAVCGHSAGGHLALWLAARHRLPPGAPGAAPPAAVGLRGVVSLAGVADLRRAAAREPGRAAVRALLGGDPAELDDRYRAASPIELLPFGVASVAVHGLDDRTVSPAMSEDFVRAAVAAGDVSVYEPIAGSGHRELIDPGGPAWTAALGHLRRFLD